MIAGAGAAQFTHVVSTILESGEVDALLVIYVPASPIAALPRSRARFAPLARSTRTDKTLPRSSCNPTRSAGFLRSDLVNIPTYSFPESAAIALSRSVGYGEWLLRDPGEVPVLKDVAIRASPQRVSTPLWLV